MSIAPTRRPRTLIALGALALALAAAGPASAEPNQPTETAKKDCAFTYPDGFTTTFKHGEKVTIRMKGSNNVTIEVTFQCNDGKWVNVPYYVQPTTTVSVSTLSAYTYPGP
jgi:hypothetical protein